MIKTKPNNDINRLAAKWLLGTATDAENDELFARTTEQERRDLLERNDLVHRYGVYAQVDWRKARRAAAVHARPHAWLRPLRIAAIAVVLVGLGVLLAWYRDYTRVTPPQLTAAVKRAVIVARQHGQEGTAATAGCPVSANAIATLVRQSHLDPQLAEQLIEAHVVTTVHDRDFWVTLDDGTLVHLDEQSAIAYPEHFGRGSRDVILKGDAFFMVAKDKSRPFIVHTAAGEVKEYGTTFHVSAPAATTTTVVLLTGSISVTPQGGHEQLMRPTEQATMTTGAVTLRTVDILPYQAWNEGRLTFDDMPLERVMTVLARWYHRDIVFRDQALRAISVSGNIDRYDDMLPTLQSLELITGLTITADSCQITIGKAEK